MGCVVTGSSIGEHLGNRTHSNLSFARFACRLLRKCSFLRLGRAENYGLRVNNSSR